MWFAQFGFSISYFFLPSPITNCLSNVYRSILNTLPTRLTLWLLADYIGKHRTLHSEFSRGRNLRQIGAHSYHYQRGITSGSSCSPKSLRGRFLENHPHCKTTQHNGKTSSLPHLAFFGRVEFSDLRDTFRLLVGIEEWLLLLRSGQQSHSVQWTQAQVPRVGQTQAPTLESTTDHILLWN